MIDQSFSSINGQRQSFRYHRHLHSRVERIFTDPRSRIVIHVFIRPSENQRRMMKKDEDINNNHDLHSVSSLIKKFHFSRFILGFE